MERVNCEQSRRATPTEGRRLRMPAWLRVKTGKADLTRETRETLREIGVCTVCEEAMCPNIGECYGSRTATFMILGNRCTRGCRFCAVRHGTPEPLDLDEPARVAEAAARLRLRYAVVTCVTRDDLPDGGAAQFVATVEALRERVPGIGIEVLPSDFGGDPVPLATVLAACPTVFNHNIETVRRLQATLRPQAGYETSLTVVRTAAREPGIIAKSGMMVGVGETFEEIDETLADLAEAGCSIVTIGQYLRPSEAHLPVDRYVEPAEFDEYERIGLAHGLRRVISGPFVRSSYGAAQAAEDVA